MDYEKAAVYWEEKDKEAVQMDREELWKAMRQFIDVHNTCALACGGGRSIRCTPIEYVYKDGCFWMLSEGGLKFRALKENDNVCIAIYDDYEGFGKLAGMQVTGTAEIVEPWSAEYLELLSYKHIKPEKLKKLPCTMHLIKIRPERIDFLCSQFQKDGYDSRQHLIF